MSESALNASLAVFRRYEVKYSKMVCLVRSRFVLTRIINLSLDVSNEASDLAGQGNYENEQGKLNNSKRKM